MSLSLPYSYRDDPGKALAELVDGNQLIDAMRDIIVEHFPPNEVFDDRTLTCFIADNYSPEDVFSSEQLRDWADENGFVLETAE